jgi:spermidine synthase
MREDPRVSESSGRGRDRLETGLVLLLFVASGVAALIYEVLWLKELGRLFGVTAHAAATTLAVFFVGLAAGGFVWGRRASRMAHPLRTYGLLELATALTAVAYFFILAFYRAVYSALFTAVGDHPLLLQGAKVGLAFGVLFLPAFFMGGTLPVMGQFLVRHPRHLGRKASLLYAANTVGAALGAFLAGFYLPVALGFKAAYLVPIALNLVVGGVALVWSRRHETARAATAPAPVVEPTAGVASEGAGAGRYGLVWTAAVVSGFTTLGLEVLWIRMFGQVLQNSVYTFAALLTVFLLALGLGSGLAHLLCRRPWSPWSVLFTLLTLSGLLVGLTPWAFYRTTSGLEVLEGATGWSGYITTVFVRVAGVILIPGAVLGCVFPYLMKLSEGWTRSPGRTIGQLAAANTGAAILGSLTAGFVLLDGLGLWASIRLMAVIDLALAALVLPGFSRSRMALRALPLACVVLFGTVVTYSGFADAHVEPGETLLQVWEGSDGTVAVVRRGEDLRMKFNNSYTLGSSASAMLHRRHAWMPLSLHPEPRTAFYLGMGTGLSAGAALDFPLRRVSVSEIAGGRAELPVRHEPALRRDRGGSLPALEGGHREPLLEGALRNGPRAPRARGALCPVASHGPGGLPRVRDDRPDHAGGLPSGDRLEEGLLTADAGPGSDRAGRVPAVGQRGVRGTPGEAREAREDSRGLVARTDPPGGVCGESHGRELTLRPVPAQHRRPAASRVPGAHQPS